eukprot:gene1353-788_t
MMNPLSLYVEWARQSPQKAHSLEHMSRAMCLMQSDMENIVASEGWWCLARMHTFLNTVVIESKEMSRIGASSYIAQNAVAGMKLVECILELLCRRSYGHRVAWDVLLAWQSAKACLQLLSNRSLFRLPCTWQSIRRLLARTLHLSGSAAQNPTRVLVGSGNGEQRRVLENGTPQTTYPTTQLDRPVAEQAGAGEPVVLVIPRVASSKLAQHRHEALVLESPSEGEATLSNIPMDLPDRFPMSWFDVLGMLLDLYNFIRPVLLVAAGRRMYHRVQQTPGAPQPMLPPQHVSREQQLKAATEAAKAREEAKHVAEESGSKTAAQEERSPGMRIVESIVRIGKERTHGPFWKPYVFFLLIDIVATVLSCYVRRRRVPAVYIGDADLEAVPAAVRAEDVDGVVEVDNEPQEDEPQAEGREGMEQRGGSGSSSRSGTPTSGRRAGAAGRRKAKDNARGTASTSNSGSQTVSQDDRRVQMCARNVLSWALRDPFFSVGLKRWLYDKIMMGFLYRIPLLGSMINYQLGYFLLSQHYSFLYSLE